MVYGLGHSNGMNDATHTVRFSKGAKTIRFEMSAGSKVVEFFDGYTRRELGRRAALNEMTRRQAAGWLPA